MTWRGRFHAGVIVVDEGFLLEEGDEVMIQKISDDSSDESAFGELKEKLERTSANADRSEFFTPDEVRAEIDELRLKGTALGT